MGAGDSLKSFDLQECGEEELATLESTAQVAAVDDGPSQARVAGFGVAVFLGANAISCAVGGFQLIKRTDLFKKAEEIKEQVSIEELGMILGAPTGVTKILMSTAPLSPTLNIGRKIAVRLAIAMVGSAAGATIGALVGFELALVYSGCGYISAYLLSSD